MRRAIKGALVLLIIGTSVGTAERRETLVEEGVPCDPPETWRVVDEQPARVPLDPSLPDINPLPISGVLVVGSVALESDVAAGDRVTIGDPALVPCRPGELLTDDEAAQDTDDGALDRNLPEG